jgi:hypothetical protein
LYERQDSAPKELDRGCSHGKKPSQFVSSAKPNRGIHLALRQGLRAVATVATIRGEE